MWDPNPRFLWLPIVYASCSRCRFVVSVHGGCNSPTRQKQGVVKVACLTGRLTKRGS